MLSTFEEYDETVLENLGLIRNKSKSFAAKGGVFCECFLPPSCDVKESFKRRECMLPLTATNIVHAKSMFTLINLEFMDSYFAEIVHTFGYEFYPEEKDYTPEFGGWIPYKTNKLNTDLVRIEDIYTTKFSKAYFACKNRNFLIRRKKYKDVSVNNYLSIDYKIDDKILKKLNIDDYSGLCSKFYIPFYDPNADVEWKKLYRKRQRIYSESPPMNYIDLVKTVLNENQNFLPPELAIERKVPVDLYENLFFNYYDYKFPICSALRYLKGTKDSRKPSTLWFLLKEHSEEYLQQSNIRKILASLCLENFINIYQNEYNEGTFLPQNQKDLDDLEESYCRPFDITYFSGSLDRYAPILKKEFRPDLKMKDEIYGRRLNLYELIYLNNLPYSIIKIFMSKNLSEEKLEQALDIFNKLRQVKPVETYEVKIEESDDDFDWSTIIKTKERPYKVYGEFMYYENPTEEELISYLLDDTFINNVGNDYVYNKKKAPVGKILMLFLQRNRLSSQLEEIMAMREEINQELKDFSLEHYPDIYNFLFQEPEGGGHSEEEADFTGDFDMFE